MAVDIKQLTGAIDYLDGMKNTLTQRVLAYDTLPTIRPLRNGHRVEVVARRVEVKPHKRQGIDRDELRKRYPAVYAAAVTVSPPPRKYGVRLEVQRGQRRRASEEWSQLAAQARDAIETRYQRRFADANWRLKTTAVGALYAVKDELRTLERQAEQRRVGLAEYIEYQELPTLLHGKGDGVIKATPLKNTTTTDYALINESEAAWMVTSSPAAGYSYIDYADAAPDPEGDADPFEGD